jgi:hypothetical protein
MDLYLLLLRLADNFPFVILWIISSVKKTVACW